MVNVRSECQGLIDGTLQGFILTATEKCTLVVDSTQLFTKLIEREMKVNATRSWSMLEAYIKTVSYSQLSLLQRNALQS